MTQDRLAIDGGTPIRTADFPAWPQYDDTERSALYSKAPGRLTLRCQPLEKAR